MFLILEWRKFGHTAYEMSFKVMMWKLDCNVNGSFVLRLQNLSVVDLKYTVIDFGKGTGYCGTKIKQPFSHR